MIAGNWFTASQFAPARSSPRWMLITLYGIPNCGTVRKARAWLDGRGVAHVFHDFRKQGVPAADLDLWLAACGWEALLTAAARRGACSTQRGVPRSSTSAVPVR
jgi:hypothetical protein